MRVRIVDLSPRDAYRQFGYHNGIVGATGTIERIYDWKDGWYSGDVTLDIPIIINGNAKSRLVLYEFKYEKLCESELPN